MFRIYICSFVLVTMFCGCKKGSLEIDAFPNGIIDTVQPKISFVFVNRVGYKVDSIYTGSNLKYFAGVCLTSGYYNINTNISTIQSNCYSRYKPNLTLTDSIVHSRDQSFINSQHNFQIELVWKNEASLTVKSVRYSQKNSPASDTVKTGGDHLIKFIWPDDTASGKYVKTYQWP